MSIFELNYSYDYGRVKKIMSLKDSILEELINNSICIGFNERRPL